MQDLKRCQGCGRVVEDDTDTCSACRSATQRPPAQPATAAPGPAPRPDPFSQIGNPLHTDWDPNARPVATTDDVNFTVESRRIRSPWWRRIAVLLIVAALAVGAWLARDQISDAYDDLSDRVSGDEALAERPPPDPY